MTEESGKEHTNTLVIGGGQAGLAVGYHLGQRRVSCRIVDRHDRIGDAWRKRWDSLRLFTPNRLNALPGLPHTGYNWRFPSKDEMADYLEAYARRFDLPVETGVCIERLYRDGERFVAVSGTRRFVADNVVVAMSSWQHPRTPDFACELDPSIVQLHVAEYRNPGQIQPGDVLVVGAGNSGAEIAIELARTHNVALSGPSTGQIPFRPESPPARIAMRVVGRVMFHRVLTTDTPVGRRVRPRMRATGEPLLRVKFRDLAAAGVERVPRVVGVEGGFPVVDDDRRMDVANVIWCTGFDPSFSWIDIPVLDEDLSEPTHHRGIVEDVPGLYFIGLKFLYARSSEQIHGIGRDAAHIAKAIAAPG